MQKKILYLSLFFILFHLATIIPGCSRDSALEPPPPFSRTEKSISPSVRDFADYHNTQVERLVLLDQKTGCLSRNLLQEFENLMQGMDLNNPEMAVSKNRVLECRNLLPTLINLHNRGHRPLEVFNLLEHCRVEFAMGRDLNPEISAGLESAIRHLLAKDTNQLRSSLAELQELTDCLGSQDEKSVVGVFLGSFERSQNARSQPWYWPWVIVYDYIGSIMGGGSAAVILSGWAELMFRNFPFHGHH